MSRVCLFLAILCVFSQTVGCQPGVSSSGITYKETEVEDSGTAENDTASAASDGSDPVLPHEAVSDSTGDVDASSGEATPSAGETPVESGDPAVVPSTGEEPLPTPDGDAAPADLELTPEQEAALADLELTPEQRLALGGIQLQPDYQDVLFFKSGDAFRVEFDKLDLEKVLNMTYIPPFASDYFPEWMKELDGQRVRLRGFMYTTFDDVPVFLLCRDLGPCCFGPNPRADYRIPVTLQEGETTDYIHQIPFDVEGTFHIHVTIDDLGRVGHTYAISDATIIRL